MKKNAGEMTPVEFESIARLFTVLADPTRLMILYVLKQHAAYVAEIVEQTGLKQSNVSKQLSSLYGAGLLQRERDGNQIRYSIGDPLVFELCNLVCNKLHRAAKSQAQLLRRVGA